MALNIKVAYPANADSPSLSYPTGSFRNDSTPESEDGTPLENQWANDFLGARDAILEQAGITASGDVETAEASDVLDALNIIARQNASFQNIAVFTTAGVSSWSVPQILQDGLAKAEVTVVGGGGGGGGSTPVNGGTSSFGAYCSATGGQTPNVYTIDPSGGNGGIGTGGDINLRGNGGGPSSLSEYQSGAGGGSIYGGGASARAGTDRAGASGLHGGGGSGNTGSATQIGQSGGGGGGAAIKLIDLSGVTSVTVTVGAAGTSSTSNGGPGIIVVRW